MGPSGSLVDEFDVNASITWTDHRGGSPLSEKPSRCAGTNSRVLGAWEDRRSGGSLEVKRTRCTTRATRSLFDGRRALQLVQSVGGQLPVQRLAVDTQDSGGDRLVAAGSPKHL